MFLYEHKVRYYETDKMQVVHHSNYIRWFEEARVEFLRSIGLSYNTMEEEGIMIPVVSVSCKYKSPAKFDDDVVIKTSVKKFNGIVMELKYEATRKDSDTVLVTGESSHCFVGVDTFKPLNLKIARPDLSAKFAGSEVQK